MNIRCTYLLHAIVTLSILLQSHLSAEDLNSASHLNDRAHFDRFSRLDRSPGGTGLREVKFVFSGLNTGTTNFYLMNTRRHTYHHDFVTRVLLMDLPLAEFNQIAYFRTNRSLLVGTILAYDQVQTGQHSNGVYTIEFWPADPVDIRLLDKAFHTIHHALPFARSNLYYHPTGETQEQVYRTHKQEFEQRGIPVINTYTLLGDRKYTAHNAGTSLGRLIVMDKRPGYTPGISDIVVYTHPPNDLSHVSGIITETPQAPLSHINLKAKQNDTPNIFLAGASTRKDILDLDGSYVRFKVTERDYTLTKTTRNEVMEFHTKNRRKQTFFPPLNLSRTTITPIQKLRHRDRDAFGAKAANLGELRAIIREQHSVPSGVAVPFSFYHQFMKQNGFDTLIRDLQNETRFQTDPSWRAAQLKTLRKQIKKAPVPKTLRLALADARKRFDPDTPLRCRSSTNSEDLESFNGAGLYDSYTHHPDEGPLEKSVKQVWASLWNFRAFEEREYHRIDHATSAMGVLIHPNYSNERANGVALTKNPFYQYIPGFYINAQFGESLVTNPVHGHLPDEILLMQVTSELDPVGQTFETIYTRRSTLSKKGEPVLTGRQLTRLRQMLQDIEKHFSKLYGASSEQQFGVDIEFKIDKNNQLVIKQARPWID